MTARNRRFVLFAALLIVCLTGCPQSDDVGPTVPVTGKVTIDNKPLESGTVSFIADDKKGNTTKAAVSGIVKGGEYTLKSSSTTINDKPGAPPGWYKVTIRPGAMMSGPIESNTKGGKPSLPDAKSAAIAAKYTNVLTTPLEKEVKQGNSPADYELNAQSK
jgi:hypothetical protein